MEKIKPIWEYTPQELITLNSHFGQIQAQSVINACVLQEGISIAGSDIEYFMCSPSREMQCGRPYEKAKEYVKSKVKRLSDYISKKEAEQALRISKYWIDNEHIK